MRIRSDTVTSPLVETVNILRMKPITYQTVLRAFMAVLVSMETTSAVIAWPCPYPCVCDSRQQTVRCDTPMGYSIPEGIPRDVRSLSMANQNLTLIRALWPATLENLRKVEIVRSNIREMQDNALVMVPRLRRLNLTDNELAEVPRAVSSLGALRELILSNNYISHISASNFRNLTKLRVLDLSINMIAMLPNDMFGTLKELRSLNLSYNIIYAIHERTFGSLTRLEDLYLSINRIETIAPGWMDNLRGLWTLEISASIINQTQAVHILPEGRNVSFPKLLNLKIASNGIRQIPCDALRRMPNLEFIDMGHNSFTSIPDFCFSGMTSIRELVMSNNQISRIEWDAFRNITGLNTIDLSHNHLEYILPYTFYGFVLKQLYLDYNRFTTITNETVLGAYYLEYLYLRGNQIEIISPSTFWESYFLMSVDFRDNRLTSIEAEFINCSRIFALAFSNNMISHIQKNAFEGTNMQILLLENNSLTTLLEETLAYIPNVLQVSLDKNPWHCDCKIRYMCDRFNSGNSYPWVGSAAKMKCASPRIFHNKSMMDIKSYQMICTTYASALAIQLIVGLSLSSVAISTALYVVQIYCKAKKLERNGGDGGKCLP